MPALHGPRTITGNNQVTLPAELLEVAHLKKGDDVYLRVEDLTVGTLLIVPGRVVVQGVQAILDGSHTERRRSRRRV